MEKTAGEEDSSRGGGDWRGGCVAEEGEGANVKRSIHVNVAYAGFELSTEIQIPNNRIQVTVSPAWLGCVRKGGWGRHPDASVAKKGTNSIYGGSKAFPLA